jgi:hypothetical protein
VTAHFASIDRPLRQQGLVRLFKMTRHANSKVGIHFVIISLAEFSASHIYLFPVTDRSTVLYHPCSNAQTPNMARAGCSGGHHLSVLSCFGTGCTTHPAFFVVLAVGKQAIDKFDNKSAHLSTKTWLCIHMSKTRINWRIFGGWSQGSRLDARFRYMST